MAQRDRKMVGRGDRRHVEAGHSVVRRPVYAKKQIPIKCQIADHRRCGAEQQRRRGIGEVDRQHPVVIQGDIADPVRTPPSDARAPSDARTPSDRVGSTPHTQENGADVHDVCQVADVEVNQPVSATKLRPDVDDRLVGAERQGPRSDVRWPG